jgi:hypothetical protein
MARRFTALLALAALVASPAAGFDSYWHTQCTQKAGESTGFSEDAWKVVQLGDFSPDLFGTIAEYRQGCGPFVWRACIVVRYEATGSFVSLVDHRLLRHRQIDGAAANRSRQNG